MGTTRYTYAAFGAVASEDGPWDSDTVSYSYNDGRLRSGLSLEQPNASPWVQTYAYTANSLNQYSQRDVPGAADILGAAHAQASLTITNASAAVWQGVSVVGSLGGTNQTNAGYLFLPKTPETFAHDADGNLTNDGRWVSTWDAENRLVKMESYGAAPTASKRRVSYTYDSQSRLVRRQVENGSSGSYVVTNDQKLLWNDWLCLADLNGTNNAMERSYLWGLDLSGSQQGAGGIGGLLKISNLESPIGDYFAAYDGNGNLTALVSGTDGSVAARYEYDPFGRTLRATGPMASANPMRFSTKRAEDTPDLAYYGYRFYNPTTGRWLNRDPIGERDSPGLYTLVANSPRMRIDGLGRCTFTREDLGYRAGGTCGAVRNADGCTWLASWVMLTTIERCPKPCERFVRISRCWGRTKSWWNSPDAATHEGWHAYIWNQSWDEACTAARRMSEICVPIRRAYCYQNAIAMYRDAYEWDGAASNWEWDCALFGAAYPSFCSTATAYRATTDSLLHAAAAKEAQCDAMQ